MIFRRYEDTDNACEIAQDVYTNAIASHRSPGSVWVSRAGYDDLVAARNQTFSFDYNNGWAMPIVRFMVADWIADGWLAVDVGH